MDLKLYEELVKKYYSITLHTILKILKDFQQSEDVNQELWIKITFKNLETIESRSPGYIVNMAKNVAFDALKKPKKTIKSTVEINNVVMESKGGNVEDIYLEKENEEKCILYQQEIYKRLSKSEVNQQVFTCMLDNMKNDEIAQKLNIPKQSVERRKSKIKKIIKDVVKLD